MLYLLVSVRDRALNAFQPPFSVRAEGEAIRNFQDAINDTNNRHLNQHPDDFDLYVLGQFDDANGALLRFEVPKQIALGKQLKIT